MELKGKKIAFLGDSITEGCGVADLNHVYWKRVEQETQAECYGYGIGGTRIAPQRSLSENPQHDLYFNSRVDSMIEDADIIIVFGGTNDYGHGDAAFGRESDRQEDSFCGAFCVLMEHLLERYPQAQIVVMTPLHRCSEAQMGYNEIGVRRDFSLEDYVDAIIRLSGYYAIPVLDLYRTSGLQPRVKFLKERYMPDGLHPNDLGHQKIADRLIGFLRAL